MSLTWGCWLGLLCLNFFYKKTVSGVNHPSFFEKKQESKKEKEDWAKGRHEKEEDTGNTFILHAIRTMGQNF